MNKQKLLDINKGMVVNRRKGRWVEVEELKRSQIYGERRKLNFG